MAWYWWILIIIGIVSLFILLYPGLLGLYFIMSGKNPDL